ncbi:gluconokinase, GntK/IdnK-type [Streptomyces niveiscabiei]|uniref:gluconokinase, GntK/IdnK-type n=1 Tax=Streptomyces niveiscabiei TaxID=164115 RepID=UPI00099F33EC
MSTPQVVVVMGVAGTGKTTIGPLLAARLGVPYAEGDDFHPPANIAKMSAGTPLDDDDRWPWLDSIGAWAHERAGLGGVVSCSALKRSYRDRLRAAAPGLLFVHLSGSRELIGERMGHREGHFMPTALLDSQFAALEPLQADEAGVVVEVSGRPEEIAERVRVQRLDDTHRRVSLRGYQEFGARFALARRKVILGDEMGLGKTIQAIAVLAHLAAEGHRRFLVVCPASVLVNWTREVEARSALPVRVLHGPARHDAFADWRGRGGVGVTTFEALRGFPVPGPDEVGLLVVDEAHAVKNPEAKRSRAVARWTERCERALFLTGTPMENRIAEFRSLVGMLDGEVAEALRDRDAHAFRRIAAPVYLRRNQRDVLTELPLLQHTDEWEELSASDEEAYRDAVRAGNFMAMRRAAYARPERSAKLNRLREIVREAAQTGQKTVVFSHFRDVLAVAGAALAADVPVYGPLDGATPAVRRQLVVDDFGGAAGPAVLLAQIQAAGVGLNVQAASVVVLCEPQTTPALEHQAVARAHRMGQVRPVRVHRLLATGGVDERLLQLLAHKARLFDTYARRSAVAEATPDAVDVSDTGLARRVVEEEQLRLGLTGG